MEENKEEFVQMIFLQNRSLTPDSKSVKDRPYGIDVLLFILTRSKIMIKILLIGARRWMFGSASLASLAWNGGKSGVWVRRKPD